ncbi:MAG: hypothetical protein M3178_13335 [Pseudomonadota bacterium]|nr:hypothetical protein [Pseudomonadota bacterium]
MQPLFANALSKAGENHIKWSDARRAILAWPGLLMMPQGTIRLARLAAPVARPARTVSAWRRPIPVKKHGRRGWSPFALGLSASRKSSPPQILPK